MTHSRSGPRTDRLCGHSGSRCPAGRSRSVALRRFARGLDCRFGWGPVARVELLEDVDVGAGAFLDGVPGLSSHLGDGEAFLD
jgi:hypothetical protein